MSNYKEGNLEITLEQGDTNIIKWLDYIQSLESGFQCL